MAVCNYCGARIKRHDTVFVQMAVDLGVMLGGLLVAQDVLTAALGKEDPDVVELARMCRNGAGMARAMHEAAHGDVIMASQFAPLVDGWLDLAGEIFGEVKSEYPSAFEAGPGDAGARARWMVDNVTYGDLAAYGSQSQPVGPIAHVFSPSPYTPSLCGICSHAEDWREHLTEDEDPDARDASEAAVAASSEQPEQTHNESVSPEFKTCPDCAEQVRYAARKCRFCGYMFEGVTTGT